MVVDLGRSPGDARAQFDGDENFFELGSGSILQTGMSHLEEVGALITHR